MKPLAEILTGLARYRANYTLTRIPVRQSYPVLMNTLAQVRRLEPVVQANAYAWFWAQSAHRYPVWRFPQVAGSMYQYFLPWLRIAPVGVDTFVKGSGSVVEQIGIPQLALLASGGDQQELNELLQLIQDNELQRASKDILVALASGDLDAATQQSITLEQTVTLEEMIWQSTVMKAAGSVVGIVAPHVMFADSVLVDLSGRDLLDAGSRVRIGLDAVEALGKLSMTKYLQAFDEATTAQNEVVSDQSRPLVPQPSVLLPYAESVADFDVDGFIAQLSKHT